MSRRLKALERVLNVRERMRDVASAASLHAEAGHMHAESNSRQARGALDACYANAPARLEAASSIDDLMRIDAERVLSQHIAREADKLTERARTEAERSRSALRERSRDVRIFEKAIHDTRTASDVRESKHEQIASDDLTSWRFAG